VLGRLRTLGYIWSVNGGPGNGEPGQAGGYEVEIGAGGAGAMGWAKSNSGER
jgi:hypothetical protein